LPRREAAESTPAPPEPVVMLPIPQPVMAKAAEASVTARKRAEVIAGRKAFIGVTLIKEVNYYRDLAPRKKQYLEAG
jgi:hypothetical protein